MEDSDQQQSEQDGESLENITDDEKDEDEEESELDGFINNDGHEDNGKAISHREILQKQLEQDAKKNQEENKKPQDWADEEEQINLQQIVSSDPDVYRVIVQRGQNKVCAFMMTDFVLQTNYKFQSGLQTMSYDITSITATAGDQEAVYIESNNPRDVERLAGNSTFRQFVTDFKRHHNQQPVSKRPHLLREIMKLDRVEQQPQLFELRFKSEMEFKPGQFYTIKRGGLRNQFKGFLCRILEVFQRQGQLKIAMLTPYRGLSSNEQQHPQRITREAYREDGYDDSYYVEAEFESGTYLQGLMVRMIDFKDVMPLKDNQKTQIKELYLEKQQNEENEGEVRLNSQLQPLQPGNKVILMDFQYKNENLLLSQGIVIECRSGYLYLVKITKQGEGASQFLNNEIEIERFQMIKYIQEHRHVKVQNGEYKGVTGTITNLTPRFNEKKMIVTVRTDRVDDVFDEEYHITTDDICETTEEFQGLSEKNFEGKRFVLQQLVKINNDIEGLITFLHHRKAQIVTVNNTSQIVNLNQLQIIYSHERLPIVQDGSNPARSMSIKSEVSVKDHPNLNKCQVIQIIKQQTIPIIFLKTNAGIKAFGSNKLECHNPGPLVQKSKSDQQQQLIGTTVRLSDPSYAGREGRIVGLNDKKYQIQLSDRTVDVQIRYVNIVSQENVSLNAEQIYNNKNNQQIEEQQHMYQPYQGGTDWD